MSKGIGRNDPCRCGSGKKYKRCHLAADQQRQSAVRVPSPAAYHELSEEIEAAGQKLEAFRQEFVELAKDARAYLLRARTIFAEEPFVPLWFTADDIQRAFDRVGDLSYPTNDPRIATTLEAAILFLAGKDRRTEFARGLMFQLPALVAAGRHLDAWVVQDCACATMENPQQSNPFLFEMFSHGFEAWQARTSLRVQSVFRKAGMDPDRLDRMSMGEIEAWLRAMRDDPAAVALLEAAQEGDPDREAQAIADLARIQGDTAGVLKRKEARRLLLRREEVEPWVPVMIRYWQEALKAHPQMAGGAGSKGSAVKPRDEVLWRLNDEMAKAIFTPERIQLLIAQIRAYRDEQSAVGDKLAVNCFTAAILSLEREVDPAHNYFLNILIFYSLREVVDTAVASFE